MTSNPKDILKDKEVASHYESIANSVIDEKGNAFMSYFVGERNYKFFSKEELPYSNAYGKIVGSSLVLINLIEINGLLKSFQAEQIAFLKKEPVYLKRELQTNLMVSSLLLNELYRRNEILKGKSLLKLLWKGGEKLYKERINRRKEEMLTVLNEPLCLLFNAYYTNKNQERSTIDKILRDFISCPYYAWDNDELCFHTLSSFMDENLKSLFSDQFDSLSIYAEKHQSEFPSLQPLLKQCKSIYQERLKELNSIEKERYNYYRNKVVKWSNQYPAQQSSSNYAFVVSSLKSIGFPLSVAISLDTPIKDYLCSDSERIAKLNDIFFQEKHFRVPDFYMIIFNTVSEVVSYWDAYDYTKNERLEMNL